MRLQKSVESSKAEVGSRIEEAIFALKTEVERVAEEKEHCIRKGLRGTRVVHPGASCIPLIPLKSTNVCISVSMEE